MIGECHGCNDQVDVYLDINKTRGADYCTHCLLARLTWAESRSGMYHFNKETLVRLINLKLIALQMRQYNRRVLEWEEKYGKPYDLNTLDHIERGEKHMNPNWMPELHEIAHLAGDRR